MRPLTIHMTAEALEKIMHWVRQAGEFEVSGFAHVIRRDFGFQVVNPVLIEQVNTSGNTEMDGHAIGKAMYELEKTPGDFAFWWHSHGHGDVYFSETDRETIRSLGGGGYLVASVFNVDGECRSCYYSGTSPRLFVDNIPTRTHYPTDEETEQAWQKEYESKVKNYRIKKKKGKYYAVEVPHRQTPYVQAGEIGHA